MSSFNISTTTVMTDDGTENTHLNTEAAHIIAQKDVFFSNSMVEAVNKHLKYQYIFPKGEIESLEKLIFLLQNSIDDYNSKPHGALFGLTPLEVMNGKIPDKHQFSVQIAEAGKERVRINRMGCGIC
ncbi:hypothetical protein RCC89_01605 [Cytophagaceae bacterium ABcell3]|nr:hypothetical protein RCC89_01605 [Cytophagaceae bacterium ABcell3]